MQETFFPMNHKLLSPKYVQPVVDKYIALTHRHLEERANQYDGLSIALRDFIVPLTFEASGHAFFGQHCPVNDLFEPFKLFDNNFHLLLAGVPKMFMRGPVTALDNLATIIEEGYLLKPGAMDEASDVIKEYERITKEGGFVRCSPACSVSWGFDGWPDRTQEMSLDSSSLFSGPSKRMRHSQRTGSSHSTSSGQTASDHWLQKLTRLSPAGTPRARPSP